MVLHQCGFPNQKSKITFGDSFDRNVGLLKTTASLLGKYAAVGGFLGRDVSADENAYGVSVGGRVTW